MVNFGASASSSCGDELSPVVELWDDLLDDLTDELRTTLPDACSLLVPLEPGGGGGLGNSEPSNPPFTWAIAAMTLPRDMYGV
jgi:hypothetical protein